MLGLVIVAWVSAGHQQGICLQPAHIIIAETLPEAWETLDSLWHTLRAVMCWVIWKDRNNHFFRAETSNSHCMISLAWNHLGIYIK